MQPKEKMFTPVSNDIHIHSIMDESLPTTLINHHQCKINPLSLQRLLLQCARPSSLFFSFVCLVFPSLFWPFFFFLNNHHQNRHFNCNWHESRATFPPTSSSSIYNALFSLCVFFCFLILNLPLFSLAHHKPDHARASHDHASS